MRGAIPTLQDVDGVSARSLAMDMGDHRALVLFDGQPIQDHLEFIPTPTYGVILYIPKCLRDSRHFIFSAEHPRSFLSVSIKSLGPSDTREYPAGLSPTDRCAQAESTVRKRMRLQDDLQVWVLPRSRIKTSSEMDS
jgi:hypothetical protein